MLLPLLLFGAFQSKLVIDDFSSLANWKPLHSEGVSVNLAAVPGRQGGSMEIAYDFHGHGGYVLAERQLNLNLPDNYAFSFWVRGDSPSNNFEFKLMDSSGQNVWWMDRINFDFPKQWQKITIRKSNIHFAWGPLNGGELKRAATMQFGVAANSGGKGKVYIEDFEFEPLPVVRPYTGHPIASVAAGTNPQGPLSGGTPWHSRGPLNETYTVDFQEYREFGGLCLNWVKGEEPQTYSIDTSSDGAHWDEATKVSAEGGLRQYVQIPNGGARLVRLNLTRSSGERFGLKKFVVEPPGFDESMNAVLAARARDSRTGLFPRQFLGQQNYWTIFGKNGGLHECLMNEDGQVEVDRGSWSIEPFLYLDHHLITWHDVQISQDLPGNLPFPRVIWHSAKADLRITGFNDSQNDNRAYISYQVVPHGMATPGKLVLIVRPLQVNPPSQQLNIIGGSTKISSICCIANGLTINDGASLSFAPLAQEFGASTYYGGDATDFALNGEVPGHHSVQDPEAGASALCTFSIRPGKPQFVYVQVDRGRTRPANLTGGEARAAIEISRKDWQHTLNTASNMRVTGPAKRMMDVAAANLSYILINRDGPALQPGSRTYKRAWIRDGSMMATALLQLGRAKEAKEFIEWYATYQGEDGKVPCVVDRRGADPVPENDSHGELIYATADVYRYTHDLEFLRRMYPHVQKAVSYIQQLRAQRMTDEYKNAADPVKRACYGLVMPSISHEGYPNPVHSYWDDFFTMKGLKDAAEVAAELGETEDAKKFAEISADFRTCLYSSIALTMHTKKISYIPGCVELGDFDATSTAIGIYPIDELPYIPRQALRATFEKYWQFFSDRASGRVAWKDYTPYELRIINAYLFLGQPDRVEKMLRFFSHDIRPSGWNHWAEVVRPGYRTAGYIGDMPHSWIGSEIVKVMRNIYLLERTSDESLLLLYGVPKDWMPNGATVDFTNMPTYYGSVTYRAKREGKQLLVRVAAMKSTPPGGVWVKNPLGEGGMGWVNGKKVKVVDGMVHVHDLPATVKFG